MYPIISGAELSGYLVEAEPTTKPTNCQIQHDSFLGRFGWVVAKETRITAELQFIMLLPRFQREMISCVNELLLQKNLGILLYNKHHDF